MSQAPTGVPSQPLAEHDNHFGVRRADGVPAFPR